jgi:hypothetical protein
MTLLKAIVHAMKIVKSSMTEFSTNLTKAAWSTIEISVRSILVLGP